MQLRPGDVTSPCKWAYIILQYVHAILV